MTATPIPRTLALTVYGDLDVSVLDEMPPGRTPVVTRVLPLSRRDEVFARMRRLLDEGRQAYVVCPLVSESESDRDAAAAESEADRLRGGELHGYTRRPHARADADRRPAGDDGRVPARRGAGAGGDDRDRGGRGRAQRHPDGDRGRRPVRPRPAAPAARPGRARRARELLRAARRSGHRRGPPRGSTRWRGRPTGSSWPRSISSCAARARCSRPSRAGSPTCATPA